MSGSTQRPSVLERVQTQMQHVRERVARIARTDRPVSLTSESGGSAMASAAPAFPRVTEAQLAALFDDTPHDGGSSTAACVRAALTDMERM